MKNKPNLRKQGDRSRSLSRIFPLSLQVILLILLFLEIRDDFLHAETFSVLTRDFDTCLRKIGWFLFTQII